MRGCILAVVTAVAVMGSVAVVHAAAGDLDRTFDGDGVANPAFAYQELLHDVGVDAQDRVYVVGEAALPRPPGQPGGTN